MNLRPLAPPARAARARTRTRLKALAVGLALCVPLCFAGGYAATAAAIYADMVAFSYADAHAPDPATFQLANYSLLADMAGTYDARFEAHHLPLNVCAHARFTDETRATVAEYRFTDNGALFGGTALLGYVSKYLAARQEGDAALEADALRVIRRLVAGFSMLLIVPNGGLGPAYGGVLARGWAGPNDTTVGALFFEDHYKHANGTGAYANYRWRGHTSNDEHAGFYLGLAVALQFVPDPYVQALVHLMVDQICQHMLATNFVGIDRTGGPSGVEQKPALLATGGFWVPLLLKLGATAYPAKYERLYYRYVAEEQYYLAARESGAQETIANYFAYNFAHAVVVAFLLLEGTESAIGRHFLEGYLQSLRHHTATHRNAYFDAIYLLLAGDTLPADARALLERTVEDHLMRFRVNHFPDFDFEPLDPVAAGFPQVRTIARWYDYFGTAPYGGLYSIPFLDVRDVTYFAVPLTVEYRPGRTFAWSKNPYELRPGNRDYDPLYEYPGISFTVPYWLGRYLGFIQRAGTRPPLDVDPREA